MGVRTSNTRPRTINGFTRRPPSNLGPNLRARRTLNVPIFESRVWRPADPDSLPLSRVTTILATDSILWLAGAIDKPRSNPQENVTNGTNFVGFLQIAPATYRRPLARGKQRNSTGSFAPHVMN